MVNLKNIKTMKDTIFFTYGEEETSKSLVHHPSKHFYSKHDIITFFGLQDHHVDDIGGDEVDVHVTWILRTTNIRPTIFSLLWRRWRRRKKKRKKKKAMLWRSYVSWFRMFKNTYNWCFFFVFCGILWCTHSADRSSRRGISQCEWLHVREESRKNMKNPTQNNFVNAPTTSYHRPISGTTGSHNILNRHWFLGFCGGG